jgi:hypothetical protein
VTQLYSCLDRIDHFEWSPNSMYVLCALYTRAIVQVHAGLGGTGRDRADMARALWGRQTGLSG